MNKKIGMVLRVVISASAIAWIVLSFRERIADVKDALLTSQPLFVALALILSFVMMTFLAIRLRWTMKVQAMKLSIRDLTYLNLVGYFFNNFLPTSIGGDMVKAYYMAKRTGRKIESMSAIIVDRLFGFCVLVIFALTTLIFFRGLLVDRIAWWTVITLAAILLCTALFFSSRRIAKRFHFLSMAFEKIHILEHLKRFYATMHRYRFEKKKAFITFCWAVIAHLTLFLINYMFARSLSVNIPFTTFLAVIPLTAFASMIPSINGLGVREGAYVFFFNGVMAPEQAFALALFWLITLTLLSVVGGFIYLFGIGIEKQDLKPAEA